MSTKKNASSNPLILNRRTFLQSTAVTGAGLLASRLARAQEKQAAPATTAASKVNVAAIGVGGKGWSGIKGLQRAGANIVAICDIDQTQVDRGHAEWPKAAMFSDFREMLEKQKDIDAVIVSTPDHTHAVAAMMAMKMGKHCYCEKPLTHDIWEARQLADAAKQYKVATQMGNQGHASEYNRRVVEWVQSGMIGKIKEVHVWTDRPGKFWTQGMTERPSPQPVPDTVKWDLWLGPAPERPYAPGYHPFMWRGWWDFGTGALGDMGCHIIDPAYWALNLREPIAVEAQTEGATEESPPTKAVVRYEFAEREGRAPLSMTWYEGGVPDNKLVNGYFLPPDKNGSIFVGEKGTILAGYLTVPALIDPKGELQVVIPEPSIPRSPGHHEEFIEACRGGAPAGSNFDYAGPLTETVLLGNLAIRAGKKLEWDGKNMKVTNDEAANKWVKREYREGWAL